MRDFFARDLPSAHSFGLSIYEDGNERFGGAIYNDPDVERAVEGLICGASDQLSRNPAATEPTSLERVSVWVPLVEENVAESGPIGYGAEWMQQTANAELDGVFGRPRVLILEEPFRVSEPLYRATLDLSILDQHCEVVPEPSSLMLLGLGALGVRLLRRRIRHVRSTAAPQPRGTADRGR